MSTPARRLTEPAWVRRLVIGFILAWLGLFLLLPLLVVFHEALAKGWQPATPAPASGRSTSPPSATAPPPMPSGSR